MRSFYLTSVEASSGKSVVALGLMETLTRTVSRLGYFRPVIPADAKPDSRIELFREHYKLDQSYDDSYGVTTDDIRDIGGQHIDPLVVSRIIERFQALAANCDAIVVEGTDYQEATAAFEFALNAELAANLQATALIVLSAEGRTPAEITGALNGAIEGMRERGVPPLAAFVNRVSAEDLPAIRSRLAGGDVPIWALPDQPSLGYPTMREIAEATGARVLTGTDADLSRTVPDVKVAAMTIPRLLDHLEDGSLIVTPGDRSDVLMAAYATRLSDNIPAVSGMVLTGGLEPDPTILRFAQGIKDVSLPIVLTELDTFDTAAAVASVEVNIEPGDDRRARC